MIVAVSAVLALLLSVLITSALVVLLGDLVQRRRDPRHGLPTYRRLRRDLRRVVQRTRQRSSARD